MKLVNPDASLGLIIRTSATCRVKGQSWLGIPTLVWPDGIDEAASDWFRALVVDRGVAISSVREYAKVLRPFLRFCRQHRRAWHSVDDDFLVMWREWQRRINEVSIGRVNTSLKTVFAFYCWAEETKRIRFHVGIYAEDERPKHLEHINFPISAKRIYSKGRHGRVYGKWNTPLTLSDPGKGGRVRHTPTEDQIRGLHDVAVESLHGERNSLMFSWAEEAGPRRAEFLQLRRSHLPTSDQLAEMIERDEPWVVAFTRKGGYLKSLNVPADLIIRTLDFVNFGRRDIVNRCKKRIVGYREPEEIFLSGTTGMPLHPDSVTAIGRKMFKKAGIENANIHRLRARFAVRTVETLVDAIFDDERVGAGTSWVETILVKASEAMGHTSPQSLRPYLTYVLNRRIGTADATRSEKLASRLRQLELYEGTLVRRLASHEDLQSAAQLLRDGRNEEGALFLREIADRL